MGSKFQIFCTVALLAVLPAVAAMVKMDKIVVREEVALEYEEEEENPVCGLIDMDSGCKCWFDWQCQEKNCFEGKCRGEEYLLMEEGGLE